ncbi:hypothetical protein HHK36_016071 [Tetracentron sinense]|uniref:Pentatricopeptide repeat-containing protein n=1 Tax=Tetracentron sinense TaxID=13715 RepID=A0A834YWJ2_TETSI|nr:hypothetical protein HHK36_016071 [Tetracentron sinense]
MVFFSSSSLSSTCNLLRRRRRRKWPLSPYKGIWQQTFDEQQAMEALKKAAATASASAPAPEQHLLSTLINSFSIYCCNPTPSAYSFVIKTLTQNSQFDQLPTVLDRLQKIEKFEPPEHIFVNLIRIYGDANMLQDAIDIFFRISKFRCTPSVYSLNALLSILCKKREGLQLVPQILLKSQEMNIRLEESSFRILIRTLCKTKKVGHAIEILNQMPHHGFSPDVGMYSIILSAMCENGDLDAVEVMGFLEEMRNAGFSPNGMDYGNVIRFLVKEEMGMDALDVLDQMKIDGIKPDIVCYTMVLDGIILAGDFRKAEEMFDEILVLGLVPDVYTYNVYINGLCKQNNVEAGFKILACMEELGCKPDVVNYNTLLGALCKVGEVWRGRELVREMGLKGVPGNLSTCRIMIDGFVSKGEIVEACRLLEEMLGRGFVPQSSTFDEMICGLCKSGLVFKALELLKEMVSKSIAPGPMAWEALLLGSGLELGFLQTPLTDIESLMQNSAASLILEWLMKDTLRHYSMVPPQPNSRPSRGFGLVDVRSSKSGPRDRRVLVDAGGNPLISIYHDDGGSWQGFSGDGDFGNENVELVRSNANLTIAKAVILGNFDSWTTQQILQNPDVGMHSLILSAMCEHRDLDAVEMWNAGISPNGMDYSNVIRFLVKRRNGSFGEDEILVLGLVPDVYTYNVYMNGLCKQNNVEARFKILACMEELGCKPVVVNYNRFSGALCCWRKCWVGVLFVASTFDEMICGLCKRGLVFEALELLKEMVGKPVARGHMAWEALLLGSGLELGFLQTPLD